MKSEEDFRHSMVVTKLFKTLTWILIILLNLGMIFFTMLRGLQRGFDWQVWIIDISLTYTISSFLPFSVSISSLVFFNLLWRSYFMKQLIVSL